MRRNARSFIVFTARTLEQEAEAAFRPSSPGQRLVDLAGIHIHTGPDAEASARALHARAYAIGRHIVFGAGQLDFESERGLALLAHELTHALQQNSTFSPLIQCSEIDEDVASKNGKTPVRDLLADIAPDINHHVNLALHNARKLTPDQAKMNGLRAGLPDINWGNIPLMPGETQKNLDFALSVGLELGDDATPGRSKIEEWAAGLEKQTMGGKVKAYQASKQTSKYADLNYNVWRIASITRANGCLDALIKVAGLVIGTDKLGHFFQQGLDYVVTKRKTKETPEAAGRRWERHNFGLGTTGVYSPADLEANRKGYQFYQDILAGKYKTQGFNIGTFINPKWCEHLNPSFYTEKEDVAKTVWQNILEKRKWYGSRIDAKTGSGPKLPVSFIGTGGSAFSKPADPAGILLSNLKITLVHATSVPIAVKGVVIDYDWSRFDNSKKGKGRWTSINEDLLRGTWGNGDSINNGGTWDLTFYR